MFQSGARSDIEWGLNFLAILDMCASMCYCSSASPTRACMVFASNTDIMAEASCEWRSVSSLDQRQQHCPWLALRRCRDPNQWYWFDNLWQRLSKE